jgi:hypothetical protein
MSKPVIFTISAAWDSEASVWSGHCDDIPAAAAAPTLDELLAKISAMALDLLPNNHPDVAPEQLFLQITALREAEPTVDSDVPCQAPNARLIALLLPFWLEGLGDGSCRGEGGT